MYKNAIRSGAILGIITIVLSLLVYIVDFTIFANWWYNLLLIPVISIGVIAYLGIEYRNETEGHMKFGNAFLYAFISFIISGFLGTIFSILLFNVIDPELSESLSEVIIEKTESMMAGFGAPQETIDEQVDQLREDMPKQFSVGGQVKSFFTNVLIMSAILSLIASLFIKKKEPEFEG